ncbi:MAG: prs [Candidatus Magasanikbacteria bacterium]|nr:prs [Candidatus Magasanikbacteria bacterium]
MFIFATRNSEHLAKSAAVQTGRRLSRYEIGAFPDGEFFLKIKEQLKGLAVVIGNCGPSPSETLEFLFLAGELKCYGIRKVVAIIPYMAYGRQDHARFPHEIPLLPALARSLRAVIDEFWFFDPHSTTAVAKFEFRDWLGKKNEVHTIHPEGQMVHAMLKFLKTKKAITVLAPDAAARPRAEKYADLLASAASAGPQKFSVNMAWIEKTRPRPGQARAQKLHGRIDGHALIVDDMVDSGGTVIEALKLSKSAKQTATVAATHLVRLNPAAFQKMRSLGAQNFFFTDSVPHEAELKALIRHTSWPSLAKSIHLVSLEPTLAAVLENVRE